MVIDILQCFHAVCLENSVSINPKKKTPVKNQPNTADKANPVADNNSNNGVSTPSFHGNAPHLHSSTIASRFHGNKAALHSYIATCFHSNEAARPSKRATCFHGNKATPATPGSVRAFPVSKKRRLDHSVYTITVEEEADTFACETEVVEIELYPPVGDIMMMM